MKIDYVEIENFKPYKGKQGPIYFSKEKNQNVTIIHGVNGAGKSKFFEAINWCLYGSSVLTNGKTDTSEEANEITHKELIKNCEPGSSVSTTVHISFSHKGKKYSLRRSVECKMLFDGSHYYEPDNVIMMRNMGDGKFDKVPNPTGEMNNILPENVRTYFLFDGEKIDNFAKPESSDDVRNAIYQILKLEVLTRSKKHLVEIADEYRQELKSISGKELKELLAKQEEKERDRDKLEKANADNKAEIKRADNKIAEIDAYLEQMKDARQLQQERNSLEKRQKTKNEELDVTENNIRDFSTTSFGIIGKSLLEKASNIIEEKRKKGEIPTNIREQFLDDLIERKECICGTEFSSGDNIHEKLCSLKSNSVSTELENDVINLGASIKTILRVASDRLVNFKLEISKRARIASELEVIEGELDEVHKKLKDSPAEDISAMEKQRTDFKNDITRLTLDIGGNDSKLSMLKLELDGLKEAIDKAQKFEQKQRVLTKQMALAQESAAAIDTIYQAFADEMRLRIEKRTQEIFSTLIWKDSQYVEVKLTPDYHLEVIDRWGFKAGGDLSAGERQVLSLSFITAMADETREEAPIIMDTPFGRLSTKHRENITKKVPSLSSQLVLFVTDEEMTGEMEKNLEEVTGERYHLHFNSSTGCTKVENIES